MKTTKIYTPENSSLHERRALLKTLLAGEDVFYRGQYDFTPVMEQAKNGLSGHLIPESEIGFYASKFDISEHCNDCDYFYEYCDDCLEVARIELLKYTNFSDAGFGELNYTEFGVCCTTGYPDVLYVCPVLVVFVGKKDYDFPIDDGSYAIPSGIEIHFDCDDEISVSDLLAE